MLLTITTTHQPATDLGYLLHKHPGKVQSFDLSFGRVHVFYPEAGEYRGAAKVVYGHTPVPEPEWLNGRSTSTRGASSAAI